MFLARVLRSLDRDELLWRFKLVVGLLIYIQTDEDWKRGLPQSPTEADLSAVRDRTIRFLSAGLSAEPFTG